MILKGHHTCCNEWAIVEGTFKRLRLGRLIKFLKDENLNIINHELISWKGKDNPKIRIDQRYYECDISFPGIICPIINPHNLFYRMVDGSHRMAKMILETSIKESYFYVIDPEIFCSLLEDY